MVRSFGDRLSDPRPLLLDGANGTELARRGVAIELPLWSAGALISSPDVVQDVHADYVEAGAEVVTANTFRTHARNLKEARQQISAKVLTRTAVNLARSAAGDRAWVAGSQAPLEDCYRPDRVPSQDVLEREHAAMAEALADADVDLILVETQNCVRELRAAASAACRVGLPVLLSVVCSSDGRLLSGETLAQAAEAVLPLEPAGILVNCLPADAVPAALAELQSVCAGVSVGAYANAGAPDGIDGWIDTKYSKSAVYADAVGRWVEQGARIIGGCCGTTPEHISRVRDRLDAEKR